MNMFGGGNNVNSIVQPSDDNQAVPADPSMGMSNPAAPTAPTDNPAPSYEPSNSYIDNGPAPSSDVPAVSAPAPAMPTDSPAAPSAEPVDGNALLDIKQQALQQLSPLVGHLDQSPEEKFRTTMMMIQASDNSDLVKEAYAAAQQITDEKTRAQALLDIVNEINYFTQHHEQE
ncbi:MAG TPA: hypothetical protein VMR45_02825 [Patescibacteria group bacterium]|nr:hypothetical protein [Patescibacteria group bacterium]